MSDENSTLKGIDTALKTAEDIFKQFTETLNVARNELINLETEKKQALEGKKDLEEEKSRLEEHEKQLEQEKERLEVHQRQLEEETNKLEKEKQERDQTIGSMTEEQMKLLDEYEKVKIELQKFAQASASQEEMEFNFERIQALLSIYRVLIEEIWQGQPAFKILLTLHGEKEEMTRDELKNTTGISGAFVLRTVQELANVDLLEYNEDTGTAKLKKRLFPKKALEDR
jgi:chromosome segregation ATPase